MQKKSYTCSRVLKSNYRKDLMFFTFLQHAWLSLRRAHYFERSIGIKLIIGFVGLSMLWYIHLLARILPGFLQEFYPDSSAHELYFSVLFVLFLSDQLMRLLGQKLPRHKIAPYLHLPVPRKKLASYTLLRGWLSPFNIYLVLVSYPFLRRVIVPDYGQTVFWLTIIGLLLIAGLSHSIVIWAKSSEKRGLVIWYAGLALAAIATWLFFSEAKEASINFGLALMSGHWAAYAALATPIAGLNYLALQNLQKSYSLVITPSASKFQGSGFMGRLFARIPVYGPYWDLEWKLLTRNKRPRANVYQWPFAIFVVLAMITSAFNESTIISFYPILLMFMGSFGFYHLQYTFSWESRFFDFIAVSSIDMKTFILAKYYFYTGAALLQLILILPVVWYFQPAAVPMLFSLMLYATGPVFALLIYLGVSNSTRLDPNKKAIFNFEGTSGILFVSILLIFVSLVPVAVAGMLLPWGKKTGIYVSTAITGLAFISTHKWWLSATARKFASKKYQNLNKYREQ